MPTIALSCLNSTNIVFSRVVFLVANFEFWPQNASNHPVVLSYGDGPRVGLMK